MSQVKLEAAAELIKEGKYQEARVILKTVDDPKAREWLAKIDSIASQQSSSIQAAHETLEYVIAEFVSKGWTVTAEGDTSASLEKKASSRFLMLLLGIPAIFVLIFYSFMIGIIGVVIALVLVALNNATKKSGSVRIKLLPNGSVSVSSNINKFNVEYPLGYNGSVKA